MPVDEERKKFVEFGNAYHVLASTYLVASGAGVTKVADANRAGFRIGGIGGTATFRASNRAAPNANHQTFESADQAVAALAAGKVDAIAFSRESLTGRLDVTPLNFIHIPAGALAILGLAGLLVFRRRLDLPPQAVALAATVLLALLVNAAVCGVFSHAAERYQSRLIPLAPLALMTLLVARRRVW
jgi:hypothetical protein